LFSSVVCVVVAVIAILIAVVTVAVFIVVITLCRHVSNDFLYVQLPIAKGAKNYVMLIRGGDSIAVSTGNGLLPL